MTTPRHLLSLACHLLAIFWLGMMAGFFATYSVNVADTLAAFDGRLYATVQSALNRNVRNPVFFAFFFGPPLWCALALALSWRGGAWGFWLLAAGLLYVGGIILLTREVNLPLNAYTESWNPAAVPADWQQTRARWNAANLWRTGLSAAAFGMACLALALRPPAQSLQSSR